MPNVQTKAFVNENEDLQKDKFQKDSSSQNGKPRDKQSTAGLYGTGDIILLQADEIYKGHENSQASGYQDFYRLKRRYSSENRLDDKLFKDPAFPVEESSIERVKIEKFADNVKEDVKWLRPKEINPLAKFFVDGYSRFDVKQGFLGDCWFLAAAASLAMHPKLFSQVVPEDNGSFGEDYAGIFHFRFWQSGHWVDVVIDDRLPTYEGELIFAKSTSTNEFWIALLEKAYAKLHGSYGALHGGLLRTAFNDLTGGVSETYPLDVASYDEYANRKYDDPYYSQSEVFIALLKAQEQNLLMGISALKKNEWKGLYGGHAYSITGVYNDEENILMRLRNPWGYGEWTGLFSDERPFWDKRRAKELREELNLVVDDDGEFWMPFKRAIALFSYIDICYLNSTHSYSTKSSPCSSKPWTIGEMPRKRLEPVHVERARDGEEKVFLHHLQHRMTLKPAPVEQGDGKHRLIVALTSNTERRTDSTDLAAGFEIYELPASPDIEESEGSGIDFFGTRNPIFQSNVQPFNGNRGVQCHVELQPGSYCIVPYTTRPAEGTKFSVELWSRVTPNKDTLPVEE